MPRRTDIHKILIIGSGPIVIGQACEFDYSGTQACRALRQEGFEVVLVNSNPATIMTDPEIADRTYIEPLNARNAHRDHRERTARCPAADGGRADRAESVGRAYRNREYLTEFGVKLIGANIDAIKVGGGPRAVQGGDGRDRHPDATKGGFAHTWAEAEKLVEETGYPAIIRPSLYPRRYGRRHRHLIPEEFEEIVTRRPGRIADHAGLDRRIDPRLEGISNLR